MEKGKWEMARRSQSEGKKGGAREAEADGASSVGERFSRTVSFRESGSKLPHSKMAGIEAALI